jgi:hypothetical protein
LDELTGLESDRPAEGEPRKTRPPRVTRRQVLSTIIVLVFFAGLAIFFTRPLITAGGTSTVKHESDPSFQAWTLAWDLHELRTKPLNLFNANILFPNDETLAYSDAQVTNALLAAPITGVTGDPMQAHNYLIIFQFFLCAVGAYLLATHLTGSRIAGVVAGVAYSYAPYKFTHIMHLNLLSAAWIPLALLFLHRYFEKKKIYDVALFALFFVIQALTTWHYGLMLAVAVGVMLVVRLIARRRTFTLKWTVSLACALLVAGLLILPFAWPYFKLQGQNPRFKRNISEVETFSADVQDFLAPPAQSLVWGGPLGSFRNAILDRGERNGLTERGLFPGLIPLVLAVIGFLLLIRKGKGEERFSLWSYLAILVLSFVMCLGYPLHFFGHTIKIPTLYELFYYAVPGFKGMRVPARFDILITLSLAVFSAFAVKWIVEWVHSKRGVKVAAFVAVLILVLVCVDLAPTSIPMQKVTAKSDFPAVYSWLAKQPGEAPTVELPIPLTTDAIRWAKLDSARDYYSTSHWKKIMNGYSGFLPDSLYGAAFAWNEFPSAKSIAFFRKEKVRFIIVHGSEMDRKTLNSILAWQKSHADFVPVARFGSDYVYRLE